MNRRVLVRPGTVAIGVLTIESRTILGIACPVVPDRAYEGGELIEVTLDWYAQDNEDKEGNVWYSGEAVSTQGFWEAGVDGAVPGIFIRADPRPGEPYPQDGAPGVAEDRALADHTGESVTVPFGTSGAGVIPEEATEGEGGRIKLIEIRVDAATPAS